MNPEIAQRLVKDMSADEIEALLAAFDEAQIKKQLDNPLVPTPPGVDPVGSVINQQMAKMPQGLLQRMKGGGINAK